MKRFLICGLGFFAVCIQNTHAGKIDAYVTVVNAGDCTTYTRGDAYSCPLYGTWVNGYWWATVAGGGGFLTMLPGDSLEKHMYNVGEPCGLTGFRILQRNGGVDTEVAPTIIPGDVGRSFYARIGMPGECITVCDITGLNDADDAGKASPKDCGMPVYAISEPWLNISIHDEPLGYQGAVGPRISLDLSYKQREFTAGANPKFFSIGKHWNFSWFSYITNKATTNWIHLPDGRERWFRNTTNDYLTNTRLIGATNTGYTLYHPDGSRDVYGFLVTNSAGVFQRAFLSERWNAQEQRTRFFYHSYTPSSSPVIRLRWVVDGDGRTNSITYVTSNAYSTNLIASVADPFGRTVYLSYDSSGRLTNIIDVAGIPSSFAYKGNSITNLTTPYGNTGFDYALSNDFRSVLVTQPDGGKELYLYRDSITNLPSSFGTNQSPLVAPFTHLLDNTDLNARNSFYWGTRQYAALSTTNIFAFATNDFLKARMKHWLMSGDWRVGSTLSLEREPSADAGGAVEGQITWYDYAGKTNTAFEGTQALPLLVAQRLPDGTTRFTRTERNSLGAVTKEISTYSTAVGGTVLLRTNTYTYSTNLIDLIVATNALGVQVLSNSYNAYHQVLTNYNALNEMTVFTYDTSNRLSTITLPTGLLTTNAYGSDGFVAQTIVTGISTNSFTYATNLVRTHTDARGLTLTNTYDALQRLRRVDFPDGTFITNLYDKLDLVRTIDRMGYSNSFGFNAVRQLVAATNALGYYNLFDYCSCGSLNWSRDAANNYTYFFYDNAGRQTNVVYADGYAMTNFYNLLGQLTNVVDSAGTSVTNWFNNQGLLVTSSNVLGRMSSATYDALDRATNTVEANGVTLTSTFDNLSRPLTATYPDGGVERWAYTANFAGPTSYTNQLGTNVVNYTYDLLGRKTYEVYPGLMTNQFAYSGAGDLIQLTDGKNQSTTWGVDIYGRPTSKTNANGLEIERLVFDANDNLLSRWTPAKGTTFYTNDVLGNVTDINYPNSPDIALQYDSLNQLTNMTDAVGTNRYTYSSVGQLLSEDGPWANDTLSYTYNNRLRASLTLQQPSGTWTNGYLYDVAKRLTNITSLAGAFGYTYEATRPTLVSKLTLPNTAYITNTYDAMTRLLSTQLKNSGGSVLNAHAYEYNVGNQRTKQTFTAGNYVDYTYDGVSQLKTALGKEAGGAPRFNEQQGYAYDAAQNLSFRTNNAFVQTFNADNLNQLTTINRSGTLTVSGNTTTAATNVTVNGLTADRYADLTYARTNFPLVDGTTNFTAIAQSPIGLSSTNTVTVDLRATNTLVYDLNGNLRTNGNQILEYDDENQLVTNWVPSAWKSEFVYDGANRLRIQRDYQWDTGISSWIKTNEVHLFYDGVVVIQERNSGNTPQTSYTRSGSYLLARTDQPASSHAYYHTDGNRNVTTLINANQLIVAKYLYDPFGNTLAMSGPLAGANLYQFASQRYHANSGLSLYLRRAYSPALQRFINRDPIEEAGGNNLFGFVANDPINGFDPLGLEFSGFHINADGSWRPTFRYPGRMGSRLNWRSYFNTLTSFGCKDQFDKDFERIMSEEATDLFPYGSLSYMAIREAIARGYLSEDDLPFGDASLSWNAVHHGYAPNLTVAEAGHLAFLTLIGAAMDGVMAASMPTLSSSEILESRVFYSVQSPKSAARLAAGGEPWPTGLQKANLGQGLYTWGNLADAEAYAAGKTGAQILRFEMSADNYSALRTLDMRSLTDEAATSWLNSYSQYGKGLPHGYDHIIRGTGSGVEYYFSPSAFRLMK